MLILPSACHQSRTSAPPRPLPLGMAVARPLSSLFNLYMPWAVLPTLLALAYTPEQGFSTRDVHPRPQEHLPVSGDIFGCDDRRWGTPLTSSRGPECCSTAILRRTVPTTLINSVRDPKPSGGDGRTIPEFRMDTSSLYFPDNLKSIHSKLNLSSKPLSLSSPFSHQVALTLHEFSSNLASPQTRIF